MPVHVLGIILYVYTASLCSVRKSRLSLITSFVPDFNKVRLNGLAVECGDTTHCDCSR